MTLNYDSKSTTILSGDARSSAGSFTNDSKASTSLTGDNRSTAGSFTNDMHSFFGITWGDDFNTWATELRTWAGTTSQLTLDIRT